MNPNLLDALHIIFSESYDKTNPFLSLEHLLPKNSLKIYKKNDIIIEQNTSVKYFYLLLSGKGSVINSITWATANNVDIVKALDVLGLVEYLNRIPAYTAYVIALTKCAVFRISVEEFNHAISEDVFLCRKTLDVLGRVTSENMNRAEINSIFHPKEILGHYLFYKARSAHLPYTLPCTRRELADELYINLRTLYRYINQMAEKGDLTLSHGKLVITEENFRSLSQRYADIIL